MKLQTRTIAEMSGAIALSTVLSFVKIFRLPQGGSVTAGSMIPILWFALRKGTKLGCVAGALYGLVRLFLPYPGYVVNPVQGLLDYPIAFGALGLAGFFKKYRMAGAAAGIAGRFVAHFLSGIVFFSEYAPEGMSPVLYSAIYNGSYLGVEIVVSAIIIYLLEKARVFEMFP
ncbi:MAG: energy-coupled thiamine transporter ThiT [Candidatus Brockarchaeota archaeon]|nr:energy-coupled thiamine transporter ThiT [Candidatus Brockarchaeota archaeon]